MTLLPSTIRSATNNGGLAAAATVLGILLSGPLALLFVNAMHPQPPWQDAALFVERYHPLQVFPYFGGMLLITALVILISSTHTLAREQDKTRTAAALVFSAAFTALIFFNYVVQTTFIPALVADYHEQYAAIVGALSMSNPTSLAWGIEMWGWALMGVATWLVAPVFHGSRVQRITAGLFMANGAVSLIGAVATAVQPRWCMTLPGLAAFAAWNVLLLVMAAFSWLAFREIRVHSGVADERGNTNSTSSATASSASSASIPA